MPSSVVSPSPYFAKRPYNANYPAGTSDDLRSVVSASSGNSTLLEVNSQRSSTIVSNFTLTTASQPQSRQQGSRRKFTAAVGKPGQARETREAVSRALNASATARPQPFAFPMDYEKFIGEKSAQLEHDRDRDLLLFLRDDISESLVFRKERTAIPSVGKDDIKEAKWLLTRDCLQHYSSPDMRINFNYSKFTGQFNGFGSPPQGLTSLRFESDEERSGYSRECDTTNASGDLVIKAGYLTVLPGEGLVDNFRSEKKRYCVVRREDNGKVFLETYKQQPISLAGTNQLLSMEVKLVTKNTRKGKYILQVYPNADSDKKAMAFSSEVEEEIFVWKAEIERALAWNKDLIGGKDELASLDALSSGKDDLLQLNQQQPPDTESLVSEAESIASSYRDLNGGMVWRGRNAAAKALHPPIVERRNLFSLYWNFGAVSNPEGEGSTLISDPRADTANGHSRTNGSKSHSSSPGWTGELKGSPFTSRPAKNQQAYTQFASSSAAVFESRSSSSSIPSARGHPRSSSPTPSTSSLPPGEKEGGIIFTAEFKSLHMRMSIGNAPPEQIEPFYLRFFIFDARLGMRISEEFKIVVPSDSTQFEKLRQISDSLRTARSMTYSITSSSIPISDKGMGTEVSTNDTVPKFNGIPLEILCNRNAHKFTCQVPAPRRDIFLVIRVERTLTDVTAEMYGSNSKHASSFPGAAAIDAKTGAKWIRSIALAHSKIEKRSIFAWTYHCVFPQLLATPILTTSSAGELPLYRCDSRLSDGELQKLLLSDFAKLEKSGKLQPISGAGISIHSEVSSPAITHDNSSQRRRVESVEVSSAYLPLRPWRPLASLTSSTLETPPPSISFELQSFIVEKLTAAPYRSNLNLLYVYPLSLNYGGQKAFSKARNIACTVTLVSGKSSHSAAYTKRKCIFDRSARDAPLTSSYSCSVQYHSQTPQFNDEIKLQLPCVLNETDHLLFEFKHIAVANALSPKASAEESFELSAGYAWLPLVRRTTGGYECLAMTEDLQEFELPIAAELPDGYAKYQPCSASLSSKESAGTQDVKFVEGGKPLFRVRLRLISTIFCTNERLHTFFELCQQMQQQGLMSTVVGDVKSDEPMQANRNSNLERRTLVALGVNADSASSAGRNGLGDDAEDGALNSINTGRMLKSLELLVDIDLNHLFPLLHVVLGRLLVVITCAASDDVALGSLSALIRFVDRMMDSAPRKEVVRDFIRRHARCHTSSDTDETTHSALLRLIPMLIKCASGNQMGVDPPQVFRQLWFLVDVIGKLMAQWLIQNRMMKVPRRDRFPVDVISRAEELIQLTAEQIVLRHQEYPAETRSANSALGNFIKYLLSLADRYAVMKQLHSVVGSYDASESRSLRVYKLEMLQILTGHEHWIPLCLPLLTDRAGGVMRGDISTTDNTNATQRGGFLSKFFAQIFSTYSAMQESSEADRYVYYIEHFYLSETYCRTHFPAGLLLQEVLFSLRDTRSHRKQVIRLLRNLLAKHSRDPRYTDTAAQNRIAVLYTPLLRVAVANIAELEAGAKASSHSSESFSPPSTQAKGKAATLPTPLPNTCPSFTTLSSGMIEINNQGNNPFHPALRPTQTLPPTQTANETLQRSSVPSVGGARPPISALSEKLDKEETRDLLLSCLHILVKLPKKTLGALWCAQETIHNNDTISGGAEPVERTALSPGDAQLSFIHMLELCLRTFRYRGRTHHDREKEALRLRNSRPTASASGKFAGAKSLLGAMNTGQLSNSSTLTEQELASAQHVVNALNVVEEDGEQFPDTATLPLSFLQECNLTQEVALTVLDTVQTLSNQISARSLREASNEDSTNAAFQRLLDVQIHLLGDNWPESVRLHALAALAVFINLFSSRFFQHGPLDGLSTLLEALLLQLNSRLIKVQNSAAALLQLVLRSGFDAATPLFTKQQLNSAGQLYQSRSAAGHHPQKEQAGPLPENLVERLGRPGAQTGVALAHLLGGKRSPLFSGDSRFDHGLSALESMLTSPNEKTRLQGSPSLFEKAVAELVKQLRGVLEATSQLSEVTNDSCKAAELRIQLANSYRGSAALRCAWFDTLAVNHRNEQWYSEAAICEAHCVAIIGKELMSRGEVKLDWSILDALSSNIATEESVLEDKLGSTQQAGYTLENLTSKVEELVQILVLSERFEAVGPMSRLATPVYEQQHNYKALCNLYAEIQHACNRANEVKATGKRHLGTYFRVVFYGLLHFGNDHGVEWIYREPRLTSLAEACDRMVETTRLSLGHDRVEILAETKMNKEELKSLDPAIAYIRITHVEPCSIVKNNDLVVLIKEGMDENDPMNLRFHTNIGTFVYEERVLDEGKHSSQSEQTRFAARRVILTTERTFPDAKRRQKVVEKKESLLSPLDLACDNLLLKARQIGRILLNAGIHRGAYSYDKASLRRLDLKQLQLFLQGAVSPSVNAGVLAYAEAFTAPSQRERYGEAGRKRLVSAFKTLIAELEVALRVNEAAIANERGEYRAMLRNSFDGMLQRLSAFFTGEKFGSEAIPALDTTDADGRNANQVVNSSSSATSAMYIFDSIGGIG